MPTCARKADIAEVDVESGNCPHHCRHQTPPRPSRAIPPMAAIWLMSAPPPVRLAGGRIVLRTRADGKERELPATFDEQPNLAGWAADSRNLYFTEWKGTEVVLYAMPVDGPPRAAFIPKGHARASGLRLNATGTHAGVALQSSSEPVEAYAMDLHSLQSGSSQRRQYESAQAAAGRDARDPLEELRASTSRACSPCRPPYEKGKRYPAHPEHPWRARPAPSARTFIGASGLYPIASFASRGYAVLRVNPRGSVGYGNKFRAANLNDWGGGDYQAT